MSVYLFLTLNIYSAACLPSDHHLSDNLWINLQLKCFVVLFPPHPGLLLPSIWKVSLFLTPPSGLFAIEQKTIIIIVVFPLPHPGHKKSEKSLCCLVFSSSIASGPHPSDRSKQDWSSDMTYSNIGRLLTARVPPQPPPQLPSELPPELQNWPTSVYKQTVIVKSFLMVTPQYSGGGEVRTRRCPARVASGKALSSSH